MEPQKPALLENYLQYFAEGGKVQAKPKFGKMPFYGNDPAIEPSYPIESLVGPLKMYPQLMYQFLQEAVDPAEAAAPVIQKYAEGGIVNPPKQQFNTFGGGLNLLNPKNTVSGPLDVQCNMNNMQAANRAY